MSQILLKAETISVTYPPSTVPAVNQVSLTLSQGETLGLIGESGSGKTSLALSLMGLLHGQAAVEGGIFYQGIPLHQLSEKIWKHYRWNDVALVFQNSLNVLNPLLTIEEQIGECIKTHTNSSSAETRDKIGYLLDSVKLEQKWSKVHPHQLSGGMRQKVLVAMALSCDPSVLLIDEPTMALDAEAKHQIVSLLLNLQSKNNFAMLVISHELEIINRMASDVMVMYSGHIMEEGPTAEVLTDPLHPYTRGLIYSSPALNPYRDMWGIPGSLQKTAGYCPFYSRCSQRVPQCTEEPPKLEDTGNGRRVSCVRGGIVTLLQGTDICKDYRVNKSVVHACHDCSLQVRSGEVAALIGESGSGKTTMAQILSGIMEADRGNVFFEGREVLHNSETARKQGIQIVFQDPLSSINSRMTIEEAVREPLDVIKSGEKSEKRDAVREALKKTELLDDDEFLQRKCYTLSGGQRQRVALARALVMNPKLLIADEISAMLDPSTAANILRLLKGLQNKHGFAMLYITHDLALTRKIADTVFVMKDGKIVEHGPLRRVFTSPQSDYTKRLIAYSESSQSISPGNPEPNQSENCRALYRVGAYR